MRPADLARLCALAAMWGASYLFMRLAVPHLGPVLMIELRVLIAGLALAAVLHASGGKVGTVCGVKILPLAVGNVWTYS